MSYDINVLDEDFNITSNLRAFFIDFGVYPPYWDGKHRSVVAVEIEAALERVKRLDPDLLADKYDADNGWGRVEHALEFLESVHAACVKPMISEIVRVSF